jgi:hypothetical protein
MAWPSEVIFSVHSGADRIGHAQQVDRQAGLGLEGGFKFGGGGIAEQQAHQLHQRKLGVIELLAGNDRRLGKEIALEQGEAPASGIAPSVPGSLPFSASNCLPIGFSFMASCISWTRESGWMSTLTISTSASSSANSGSS